MITISNGPATPYITKYLTQGLIDHALQNARAEVSDPMAFVAKDGDTIVGGIQVEIFFGQLHIRLLYVDNAYRKYGVGKKLMEEAMNFGREMKCSQCFVETMSFQALGFYQKLGFLLEFTRTGYAHGAENHHLRKDLRKSI